MLGMCRYEVEITTWPAGKSAHATNGAGASGGVQDSPGAVTTAFYVGAIAGVLLTVLSIRVVRALVAGKRLI